MRYRIAALLAVGLIALVAVMLWTSDDEASSAFRTSTVAEPAEEDSLPAPIAIAPAAPTRVAVAPEPAEPVEPVRGATTAIAPRAAVPVLAGPREGAPAKVLRGIVVDPTDLPLAGAQVSLGWRMCEADADGQFAIAVDEVLQLVAMSAGYAPTVVASEDVARHLDADALLHIRLDPMATIAGRVVTEAGAPCVGWHVELIDGTRMSGALFDGDVVRKGNRIFTTGSVRVNLWPAEAYAGGQGQGVETGAAGNFVLRGLRSDRAYRLLAWSDVVLARHESGPVPAGTLDFQFVVPVPRFRGAVEGVVVDQYGAPVADVRVRLSMKVRDVGLRSEHETAREAHTAYDGRFSFLDVQAGSTMQLRCDGEGLVGASLEIGPDQPATGLRIEVLRTVRVTVAPADPARLATALAIENASGERLRLKIETEPGSTMGTERLDLEAGRSPEISVVDDAAYVVLYDGDIVLHRIPVTLRAGETNAIVY